MDTNYLYKFMEFAMFSSYLILIFLSVQIWFLWKDIDKGSLNMESFINESFFRKNCIYFFGFSIFFIIPAIFEGIGITDSMLFFKLFDMLGFISIVMFEIGWYKLLKTCANKKSLPQELINFKRTGD